MRIKRDLVLRFVADTWIVIPLTTSSVSFNGMITLNETGARLWKELEKGAEKTALVKILTEEYAVDYLKALEDVEAFLVKLEEQDVLEQ